MSIYTDEIFGPVLSVVRVSTYDEALKLVNDHEYGNGAAIFTRDGDTARHYTTYPSQFLLQCIVLVAGRGLSLAAPRFMEWKV